MVRSGRTPSEAGGSAVGSRVGSAVSESPSQFFAAKAIEKRHPGHWDKSVLSALKGGGMVSAAMRGGPLFMRACQECKDVAEKCSQGMQCPFLANKIDAMMLNSFPKDAEETEMAEAVFRFVNETAAKDDLRALQVMATALKPTEQRCLVFVRKHKQVLGKMGFAQQMLAGSKTVAMVEAEAPEFLKSINAPDDKADVAALVDLFKMMEDFQPFLVKHKEAEAAKDSKKKSMHGDSEAIEKFLNNKRFKGDRTHIAAILLMSCAPA